MWNPPYAVGDCRGPAPFVAGIMVHWQDSKPDYARVTGNPEVIPMTRPRTDREVTDRLNVQFAVEAMYRSKSSSIEIFMSVRLCGTFQACEACAAQGGQALMM
jgi:hypothetical protein